jgi:methyltransferase (TIGR00027 family)
MTPSGFSAIVKIHMENQAAETAWGPIFQVALEQLAPIEGRVIQDAGAYQILPAYLKTLVNLCRIGFVRYTLLNLMERGVPGARGGILCRKRYITDKLDGALQAGVQSIVILGSGFDTLTYRLPALASRQVFEVDFPKIIQTKKETLERIFGRVPAYVKLVPLDFDGQDLQVELGQAGYSGEQATFFVWEGVTQYISEMAVRRVFDFFRQAPPGSQLVFTYIRKDFIEGKNLYGQKIMYHQTRVAKQLWQFGLDPTEIEPFLSRYGWKELEQMGSAEYQQRYLEPVNRHLQVMEVERAVHAERMAEVPHTYTKQIPRYLLFF